jgi:hypothetical protein
MIVVSGVLANESRKLLIGGGADQRQVMQIRQIVEQDPEVKEVGQLLTMHLGPRNILVNIEIQFKPQGSLHRLEQTIKRPESHIREKRTRLCATLFWKRNRCIPPGASSCRTVRWRRRSGVLRSSVIKRLVSGRRMSDIVAGRFANPPSIRCRRCPIAWPAGRAHW